MREGRPGVEAGELKAACGNDGEDEGNCLLTKKPDGSQTRKEQTGKSVSAEAGDSLKQKKANGNESQTRLNGLPPTNSEQSATA